jgi:hypothetical protein
MKTIEKGKCKRCSECLVRRTCRHYAGTAPSGKKFQYSLRWMESHDPENWADDNGRNGVKNIKASFPKGSIFSNDGGMIDCFGRYDFAAKNLKEAMKIVRKYQDEQGTCEIVEVFSVYKKIGNRWQEQITEGDEV